jgi:hypothetical protein
MSALKTAALIAASALIAVLAISADPQNNPKDEKAVIQVAGEAREASRTHDLMKIQQMLTEDFLAIDPSGRLRNKAEFIDMMRNMSPELVVANAELPANRAAKYSTVLVSALELLARWSDRCTFLDTRTSARYTVLKGAAQEAMTRNKDRHALDGSYRAFSPGALTDS